MSPYIFQPPAVVDTVPLTYESALAFIRAGRTHTMYGRSRKLGATVTLEVTTPMPDRDRDPIIVSVRLYDTTIAYLFRPDSFEGIHILDAVDVHRTHATRWWVSRILRDNGYFGLVHSQDFTYYLWDSGVDVPIAGRSFPHDHSHQPRRLP